MPSFVCSFALWKKSVKCPIMSFGELEPFSSAHSKILIPADSDLSHLSDCTSIWCFPWKAFSFSTAPWLPQNGVGIHAWKDGYHLELGDPGWSAMGERGDCSSPGGRVSVSFTGNKARTVGSGHVVHCFLWAAGLPERAQRVEHYVCSLGSYKSEREREILEYREMTISHLLENHLIKMSKPTLLIMLLTLQWHLLSCCFF